MDGLAHFQPAPVIGLAYEEAEGGGDYGFSTTPVVGYATHAGSSLVRKAARQRRGALVRN